MFTYLQESDELQKYWKRIEDIDEHVRDERKKIDTERKKLELGSDYKSELDDDTSNNNEEPKSEDSQVLEVLLLFI